MGLPLIRQLGFPHNAGPDQRERLLPEQRPAFRLVLGKAPCNFVQVQVCEPPVQHRHKVVLAVRDSTAPRRGDAGRVGHQRLRCPQLAEERTDQQWPGAAGGKEGKVTRIVPAINRDTPQAPRDPVCGDGDDGLRRRFRRELERPTDPLGNRRPSPGHIKREVGGAADRVTGVDPAQHELGVGERRLGAATPIPDRPRLGPGALRPHPQDTARINASDTPPTRRRPYGWQPLTP